MKLLNLTMPRLSRDARVGIVAAALIAAGIIFLDRGWHLAGGTLLAAGIAITVLFYALIVRPARLPKDAVLSIRLADGLREDAPRSLVAQLRNRSAITLLQLRQALEAAATDVVLKTVILEIYAPGVGLATAQELHDLLRAIVAAGKRVVTVVSGDNLTVGDYLLASGASEIVVNPDTAILMLGVGTGTMFFKQALAKLGIEAQTLQWKEYKGAGEVFDRETMSPELRESLQAIVNDWLVILAANVAAARKLTVARARELLAAGFLSVTAAREAGLIDRAGYLEDLRDEIAPENADKLFIGLHRYLRHLRYRRDGQPRPRFALIHGLGPVVTGETPLTGEYLSGERVAAEIRRAARDDEVRAIVFRVNSPGGSAVGSDLVWRAIREAQKRGKPVVVSMGDVAGSGGYYVAMGADAIVAEPATITGSIGVVYTKFSLSALLGRLGVSIDVAKSDSISDALSLGRTMTPPEIDQINLMVGQLYAAFTAKVAEGRKLDAQTVELVARGRVWSGVAAKANGLIDELGGLDKAIAIARVKAGLHDDQPHDLVPYHSPNFFSALSLNLTRDDSPSAVASVASIFGLPPRWSPALLHLLTRGGLLQMSWLWPQ